MFRTWRPRVVVSFLCLVLLPGLVATSAVAQETAKAFERRAFDPGGPETLIRTGDSSETKLTSASRTATSLSFSFKTIYHLILFLDEAGARKVFEPFKGQKLEDVLKKDEIHQAVVIGEFPKVFVMRFTAEQSGKEIKESLNEDLLHSAAYGSPEAKKFVNYFKGNFKPGDEVVIRIAEGSRVLTTVANREQPEIRSQAFARALAGIWVGKDKKSGSTTGLLSEIEPLLK